MPPIQTREEYRALPALNYSGAKELLKSPAHYKAYLTKPQEETKALKIGSAVHAYVLQPDVALATYAVAPAVDRRTSAGKAAWESFAAANAGKTVLTEDESALICGVSSSMRDTLARMGVEPVATELMLTGEYCGTPLKVAIDLVGSDGYLWDLKTTEDASPKGFLQSVRAYRYNLQAYLYRLVYEQATGNKVRGFRFLATEKAGDGFYPSAVYELGPELMTYAISDFNAAATLYKTCATLDEWPAYPLDVQTIDVNAPAKAATSINFA
jgi:exodeoxyribonuclease VIII